MSDKKPNVLFVCNTNGGKSQLAAALLRQVAGEGVQVHSAGLVPAHHINELAADVVAELGADMRAEVPTALTEEALRAADRVVIVGEAQVPELEGVTMERWVPAEAPAELATERERMEFLRDDIAARVSNLNRELGSAAAG
ncbi:arsenate-mycothiol transferase ArsC [Paeniglutamicibacter psychrophenolicus]|uniref:arsenate-mycothiol transferase ArsC n=1 Tax=Paeniglutamicibacter psychrophenolicus TaxID=257454 RepID=UPI00277F933C|nr:low molecular weight phosphatase family protein [Paeniglutamicibacter psychrophenolicus]MDQ0094461.1 arsenate-mycothiol transferase [Paeniglutamicibacter psychrophenolicus]